MNSLKIKRAHVWIVGLIIIAATALVAFLWLSAHKPHISAAEELATGQRVCKEVNDIMTKTGGTIDPPLTVADCIAANKDCENRWGSNAVWAGASDAIGVPACDCDTGYYWATDGSGKCVAQQ